MIYCVSDIHGELDKLERMMELIRFSDADHLYIIGDVIDRGVMGVDILRLIMAAPNKDRKNSRILHSVDFAFVNDYEDDDGYDCQEYIHYNKKQNTYSWSEQSQGFYMLPERFQWIKGNGLKDELDALYIRKKNNNDDPNKHSRSLFAEAVNACYNENCGE